MSEFIEVPVLRDFDQSKPIGTLRLLKAELPPSPEFCLALGFIAESREPAASMPGTVPTKPYVGPFTLMSVAIVPDALYAKYLDQVGVKP